MSSICILGRQPELGAAELESLFGTENTRLVGNVAVELQKEPALVPYSRLGGTVKLAQTINTIDGDNWYKIEKQLVELPYSEISDGDGKLTIGLSVYGLTVTKEQISKTLLKI